MDDGRIGVDESGKGDYFGPLVIAACYVANYHYAELEGVADSKKLTDKKAMELERVIKKTCPYAVVSIGPAKYNELYAKIGNLNRLLEWGHAQAIANVLEKQEADLAISDQFAKNTYGLQRQLTQKGIKLKLESRVRAESDMAVAAASILARAEFLRRLERLGEEAGIALPKGAGPNVDAVAKKLGEAKGLGAMPQFAKMHFRTTEKVFGTLGI
ncbi:ribonuclease HIII [Kamptonema cortianum]|nr:ribonuclease HIII [Geitlerinema splendidum]MDK3162292.1 ribonuclease HIII [Kamptonema cortianum]